MINDRNTPNPGNTSNNEEYVVDIESDVEEEVVENQQQPYIKWDNGVKDGV